METVSKVLAVICVLMIALMSSNLTNAIANDKPASLVFIYIAGLVLCCTATLVHIFRRN